MSKHTPGPWEFWGGDGGSIPPHVRRVWRDEHGRRCTTFIADCNDIEHQAEPNARLIAAAPELLEALEEAAEVIAYDLPNTHGEDCDHCARAIAGLEQARAAIKKARGE